MQWRF